MLDQMYTLEMLSAANERHKRSSGRKNPLRIRDR
ncbi:hypothetical protein BH23CHL2_BH23CHL2_28650 [soil metagenome]